MTKGTIKFSVIGLNHGHIFSQSSALLNAGAQLVSFYSAEDDLAAQYSKAFPQAQRVSEQRMILEDPSTQLVVSAAIPVDRAEIGMAVMQNGKDYMSDKPGFTTLEQISKVKDVCAQTGRIYSIYFSERLGSPAAVKAGELVQAGRIGQVVQTVGLGPHRINVSSRPDWFFKKDQYGGILVDIASHQVDQFLFYTGSKQAEVSFSAVANYAYPQFPELEDFGEMGLRSSTASGYIRVDWYTPDGLPTWGDGRMTILGTEGTIEVRKYVDLCGRLGGDHLFLVDKKGVEYVDCKTVEMPYGRQLVDDILNRTQTALNQEHVFRVSELAIQAENMAVRMGCLSESSDKQIRSMDKKGVL